LVNLNWTKAILELTEFTESEGGDQHSLEPRFFALPKALDGEEDLPSAKLP
jgi:hypothetical protein